MNPFVEIIEVKNCRKYLKRCYLLKIDVDKALIGEFSEWGIIEINEFSKYSPLSKDSFKVDIEEALQITGVINDSQLFITIAKTCIELLAEIETMILNWYQKKLSQPV